MITIRPGSHVHTLLTMLSFVGEYPVTALGLLGSMRSYKDLIHKLTTPQEFRFPDLEERFTCRLLTVSGKGKHKTINRISAWTVGFRNVQKALLMALCTPDLTELQNTENFTELMVIQEELKTMPFGEIWEQYCRECGAPADGEWFATVKQYETEVLSKRG